jgi:hypothetical protein
MREKDSYRMLIRESLVNLSLGRPSRIELTGCSRYEYFQDVSFQEMLK